MKYLLDAGMVVAAIKGRLPVVLKLSSLKPEELAVSVVSRMQVEAALRAQPGAQARFGKLLREFFASVRVLDFGAAEVQQAVNLSAFLQQAGETMAALDLQVAATALAHQLMLVTDRVPVFATVPNLDIEAWK